MPKKNRNLYEDMDETMPLKKMPGKQKDKNWKNHLLDKGEEESFDISSLENFKGFDEPFDDSDDDEIIN